MDIEYRAWLAGFIDGDGSFTINMRVRSGSGGVDFFTFNPIVSIRQKASSGYILEEIKEKTGIGRLYKQKRDTSDFSLWQTTNHAETLDMCLLVYEFLRLKKDQCEKLMRMTYLLNEWSGEGYNADADRMWTLYRLYDTINEDSNWSHRRKSYTREDIEDLASAQAEVMGNKIARRTIDYNLLNSLPREVLHRVMK